MKMVDDNVGNQVRHNAVQNDGNEVSVENMNGLSVVSEISNQYGNGNVKTVPTEETKRVKVNYTSEDTLQQASTSGTQSENALIYESDRSARVPKDENYYDHDIFNMLSQEVQYKDLQTKLDRTKQKLETCIIKKEKEYATLWNNWTNPSKTSRVDNIVPNKLIKTSAWIKPITVSQPNVIHKQQANSDSNGFSSTRVNNIARTRRPHPRSNFNTDRVPSKSKSSCLLNNVEKIEENHRNSQIPKNQKHMSSDVIRSVGNKMHKAFPLPGESSHWQYNFPLLVEGVPTARRMEIPLPGVCTAMMKKLPVKENWHFFIIAVQTPGSGISILLAVGTPSTGSGNLYCQWELSPGSGNALCILFPTKISNYHS
nr:hypothetical protein [Tanacetum cinerariifolium]